jgi:hypothetical protein
MGLDDKGLRHLIGNGQTALGLLTAPKVRTIIYYTELGNPDMLLDSKVLISQG